MAGGIPICRFDLSFPLVEGDRSQALSALNYAVVSESFAKKLFGAEDPLGKTFTVADSLSLVVSGVMRDMERTSFHPADVILRWQLIKYWNFSLAPDQLGNAVGTLAFVLAREWTDFTSRAEDMRDWFKTFFWVYKRGIWNEVRTEPLEDFYFSGWNSPYMLQTGDWDFVLLLLSIGILILVFAVINYINLTVAQAGFRAKEMATRRLLGASKREIVIKLILESTLMCCMAFLVAVLFAEALEPYATQLLGSKIDISESISPQWITAYVLFLLVLGSISGAVPATIIARCEAIDVMRGSLRRQTKQTYSKVLIVVQNILTVLMLSGSLTVYLQTRHLIEAPLGYETKDILSVHSGTLDFSYNRMRRFRDELRKRPEVEAVSLSYGTPLTLGTNLTIRYE